MTTQRLHSVQPEHTFPPRRFRKVSRCEMVDGEKWLWLQRIDHITVCLTLTCPGTQIWILEIATKSRFVIGVAAGAVGSVCWLQERVIIHCQELTDRSLYKYVRLTSLGKNCNRVVSGKVWNSTRWFGTMGGKMFGSSWNGVKNNRTHSGLKRIWKLWTN